MRCSGIKLWAFVLPFIFFACVSEPEAELRVITETQDKYAALAETVPGLLVLPGAASSGVAPEVLHALEDGLRRQLAGGGKFKPLTMGRWLAAAYGSQKAAGPFALLTSLREERYPVPLQGLCKMYVFYTGDHYGVYLSVFSFSGSLYPVSVLRFFREGEDAARIASACLEEAYARFFVPRRGEGRKRLAIESFSLEFRKLLELESGEFEFIAAPLSVQQGHTLREGDDYFSLLVGYCLAAADMFEVMRLAELSGYAGTSAGTAADYLLRGRVQLSAEMNILYADLYAASGGQRLASLRHPFKGSGLKAVWDACREVSALIIESIFPAGAFGQVPPLEAPGRGFFCNNMLVGRDSLERCFLPRGMYEIRTGSYLRQDDDVSAGRADGEERHPRVFYVLLDRETRVFYDREGEYLWNLLRK